MAVTYSDRKAPVFIGAQKMVQCTVTFDSSYPTGGEAVAAADFGLSRLDRIECRPREGYVLEWDGSRTSPKILAYWVDTSVDGAALAEVANTTDLSAVDATVFAWGV